MARPIPRFEADPRLFTAPRSPRSEDRVNHVADIPDVDMLSRKHQSSETSAKFGLGAANVPQAPRSLRWDRLEGLDAAATLPDPVLPLPQALALDVAPPQAEDVPEPEDFAEAISEAVDVPPEWAALSILAGGTPIARCLREMLIALNWTGDPRQVAEVLPIDGAALDHGALAAVFADLGYTTSLQKARLADLGPSDLPGLFVSGNGDAYVLSDYRDGELAGFDGKSNLLRPILADRTSGVLYRFSPTEVGATGPGVPGLGADGKEGAKPARYLWASTRGRRLRLSVAVTLQGVIGVLAALLLLISVDHAIPAGALPIIFFYSGAAVLAVVIEILVRVFRDRSLTTGVIGISIQTVRHGLGQVLALPVTRLRGTTNGTRCVRFWDTQSLGGGDLARFAVAYGDFVVSLIYLAALAGVAGWLAAAPAMMIAMMLAAAGLLGQGLAQRLSIAARAADRVWARWIDDGAVRAAAAISGCGTSLAARMDQEIERADDAVRSVRQNQALVNTLGPGFAAFGLIATGLLGFNLIDAGRLTPGEMAAGLFLSWMTLAATGRIVGVATLAHQEMMVHAQVQTLTDMPKDKGIDQPSAAPRKLIGYVDISHLSTAPVNGIEMPLNDVSVHGEPGEVIVIAGDYQSGKSGLLQVLAGLLPPSSGQARLDGISVSQFDPVQLRQSVAYVPEKPQFLPLTIAENLRLMHPLASEAQMQAACAWAGIMEDIRFLEVGIGNNRTVGFGVRMDQMLTEPVPGFFKKLALARGYLRDSSVLLLDGPERHLDPAGEQDLMAAIESLRGERTIVIATDRPTIIRLADTVVWLDGGQVRASGPSSAVLEQLYAARHVGQTLAAP